MDRATILLPDNKQGEIPPKKSILHVTRKCLNNFIRYAGSGVVCLERNKYPPVFFVVQFFRHVGLLNIAHGQRILFSLQLCTSNDCNLIHNFLVKRRRDPLEHAVHNSEVGQNSIVRLPIFSGNSSHFGYCPLK